MCKIPFRVLFLLVLVVFVSCTRYKKEHTAPVTFHKSSEFTKLIDNHNRFAFNQYHYYAYSPMNFMISPMSTALTWAALYKVAQGQVSDDIQRVCWFRTPIDSLIKDYSYIHSYLKQFDESPVVYNDNRSFWLHHKDKLEKKYRDYIDTYYGQAVYSINQRESDVQSEVLSWLSGQHISIQENVFSEQSLAQESLLIFNTLQLQTYWQHAFNDTQSLTATFFYDNLSLSRDIVFMRKVDSLYYMQNTAMQFVEIPFAENLLSMIIVLPLYHDEFREVEKAMKFDAYKMTPTPPRKENVHLILPRFNVTSLTSARIPFDRMGLGSAFSGGDGFSLSKRKKHKIQNFYHYIEFGTTESGVVPLPYIEDVFELYRRGHIEREIIIDRPFFFLVRENRYGLILLMGRMFEPV